MLLLRIVLFQTAPWTQLDQCLDHLRCPLVITVVVVVVVVVVVFAVVVVVVVVVVVDVVVAAAGLQSHLTRAAKLIAETTNKQQHQQ